MMESPNTTPPMSADELSKKKSIIMMVGGTDPTGGAGLATDIGIARMMQSYPMPVVSCITSQDSHGFRRMQTADLDIFKDQIESILTDVVPDAVKIGMIPSERHLRVLAEMLCLYEHGPVIFDPIMAPTSGAENFNGDWWSNNDTIRLFMSQVELITPNAVELDRLTANHPDLEAFMNSVSEVTIENNRDEEERELIRNIGKMHLLRLTYGINRILLTGGHNIGRFRYSDFLLEPRPDAQCPPEILEQIDDDQHPQAYSIARFGGEEINTQNTHGTGCVYSSAIACLMAKGLPAAPSIGMAKEILTFLLKNGKDWKLYDNGGYGPAFSLLSMPDSSGDTPFFRSGISDFLN